jgi:protein CWC15
MTTAHRPTYNPTRGGSEQGGNKLYIPSKMYSSKDLPSNLNLKTRRPGQGTIKDVKGRDFKKELMARENKNLREIRGLGLVSSIYEDIDLDSQDINGTLDFTSDLPQLEASKKKPRTEESENILEDINKLSKIESESQLVFPQDKDFEYDSDSQDFEDKRLKKNKSKVEGEKDKDNLSSPSNDNQDKNESSEFSNDQDEDDSEEELYRELEKIKKMREEQNKQKEMEDLVKLKQQTQEDILKGNPLISHSGYSLKKKWFEDTVFKNQAKNEPKIRKRFINDTVRSDFHRKFISKTIQ